MRKAHKLVIEMREAEGNFRQAEDMRTFYPGTFDTYTKSLARRCSFKDAEW